jgi:hypothetical protein
MRGFAWRLGHAAIVVAALLQPAMATSWEERSAAGRGFYTTAAMVANVTPIVSAVVAKECLPGYILCKASFAFVSGVAALAQLAWSGGGDREQTRAILYRGFAGDWYLTGRHVAGDVHPEPWPQPAPPQGSGHGGFEPPPL